MKIATFLLLSLLSSCNLVGVTFSEFSKIRTAEATVCLYSLSENGNVIPIENSCKLCNIRPLLSKRHFKADYIRSIHHEGDKVFVFPMPDGEITVTNPGIVIISTTARKGDMQDFGTDFYEQLSKSYSEGKPTSFP